MFLWGGGCYHSLWQSQVSLRPFKKNMPGFRYLEAEASNELVEIIPDKKGLIKKGSCLYLDGGFSKTRGSEKRSSRVSLEGVFVLPPPSARESLKSGYLCVYPVAEVSICFAAGSWFCLGTPCRVWVYPLKHDG